MPVLRIPSQRIAVWLGVFLSVSGMAVAWRSALGEWVDSRQTGPFQLRSEFKLGDDVGRRLIQEIESLQTDVLRQLNLTPRDEQVEINLFRTRFSYQSYLKQRVPQGASRPALFVKGTDMGRVYIYRHWGYEQDLRHECTHAVLHSCLPYVPMWLDEGLAEYFESAPDRRVSGSPHLSEIKRRILFGWKPNLPALEQLQELKDMNADDYRESWAWAHFMLHGPLEARQVLSDYLYDIQSGNLAGRLSDRLQARVPDATAQLVSHLRAWR